MMVASSLILISVFLKVHADVRSTALILYLYVSELLGDYITVTMGK